ncbi:hypothetical protein [Legionella parisiensis]|uniref:Uncharacterized protein n=1 Tax=Legionella parisiensis TaxID=45071 RepID=A0A1E5JXV5_9GAMM|nr:hypothetical protein [Legionella parisiensis]KTD42219.1 hypothetical protein Lpar_3536 [Legionella parisiensis]OEH48888.1 hypothetical protein lpari_00033 [Legionella parisiensis]STX72286.1 Uncharacterised protein [Legionella parisiensis]
MKKVKSNKLGKKSTFISGPTGSGKISRESQSMSNKRNSQKESSMRPDCPGHKD